MKIESLKEFVVFARTLNISFTAKNLHMSQSTLSRHILEMEKELGFELIGRGSDTVLTPAGSTFLSVAEKTVESYEVGVAACVKTAGASMPSIVIQQYGGHPDVSAFLSALVGDFKASHAQVAIEWKRYCGLNLTDALIDGSLDVAQTVLYKSKCDEALAQFNNNQIDVIPLYDEGIVLWMKRTCPLAQFERLRITDLDGLTVALPWGKVFNPMRDAMHDLFESQGLTINFSYLNTQSVSDIYLDDYENIACALPPTAAYDQALTLRKDMQFVGIDDVRSGFTTCALFRHEESKAVVRAFKDYLTSYLSE